MLGKNKTCNHLLGINKKTYDVNSLILLLILLTLNETFASESLGCFPLTTYHKSISRWLTRIRTICEAHMASNKSCTERHVTISGLGNQYVP